MLLQEIRKPFISKELTVHQTVKEKKSCKKKEPSHLSVMIFEYCLSPCDNCLWNQRLPIFHVNQQVVLNWRKTQTRHFQATLEDHAYIFTSISTLSSVAICQTHTTSDILHILPDSTVTASPAGQLVSTNWMSTNWTQPSQLNTC